MKTETSKQTWEKIDFELDDCTQAFKEAARYMRKEKIMNVFKKIAKCFSKDSYKDKTVQKINISVLVASLILFCFACVLFFL